MNRAKPTFLLRHQQQGAALMIGLVLLLAMTFLGLGAMRSTTLQERMAGAIHEQNLALQAAESALRAGEQALLDSVILDFNQTGWYDARAGQSTPGWRNRSADLDQVGDNGVVEHVNNDVAWAQNPQYYVERISVVEGESTGGGSMALGDGSVSNEYDMFRIVARGFGNNPRTVVVLESTFRR